MEVMVIEDEELLIYAIQKKLETAGIAPKSYKSAVDALAYLQNAEKLPDAIWLDYYLGDMNGIEFMHKLKEKDRTASIPVVVVSNSANQDKVSAMFALGVKKYFLKADHKLEEIVEEIKELVNGGK